MTKLIYLALVTPVVLVGTCPISVYGAAEGSFDRTLNVSGTIYLEVSTGSGNIDIRRGEGNRVEIRGFGAFSVRARNPRVAINPKNKARVDVPSKNIVHFKTGKELHDRLNAK